MASMADILAALPQVSSARPSAPTPTGARGSASSGATGSKSAKLAQFAAELATPVGGAGGMKVSAPKAAAPKKDKPKSLFEQAVHAVTSIPAGTVGLLNQLGTSGLGPFRAAIDYARGEGPGSIGEALQKYEPLPTGLAMSAGHTIGDIAHPTHFAQASDKGEILSKIIEDVGNIAAVAGGAGKVLGAPAAALELADAAQAAEAAGSVGAAAEAAAPVAGVAAEAAPVVAEAPIVGRGTGLAGIAQKAGMEGTAQTIGKVGDEARKISELGGETANAPAKPYQLAGQAVSKGVEAVTGKGVGELLSQGIERAAATPGAAGCCSPSRSRASGSPAS